MKGLSQKAPDFKEIQGIENSIIPIANTTKINPIILNFLEEYIGIYRYHTTQDTQVDIVLDVGHVDSILIRLDDVEAHLVEFIQELEPGQKIAVFRLDEPPKYYIRKIGKGIP